MNNLEWITLSVNRKDLEYKYQVVNEISNIKNMRQTIFEQDCRVDLLKSKYLEEKRQLLIEKYIKDLGIFNRLTPPCLTEFYLLYYLIEEFPYDKFSDCELNKKIMDKLTINFIQNRKNLKKELKEKWINQIRTKQLNEWII